MCMNEKEVRLVVKETVKETLLELGIAHESQKDAIEMQADFKHLRSWRKAVEAVRRRIVLTVITVLITGLIGLVYTVFTKGS